MLELNNMFGYIFLIPDLLLLEVGNLTNKASAVVNQLFKSSYNLPTLLLQARQQIITNLLANENNDLTPQHISEIANITDGYSGADMKSLCSEAAMGPIRSVPLSQIVTIDRNKVAII